MARTPIIHEDTAEVLGFIEQSHGFWTAQTLFGYVFARSESQAAAEEAVRSQGLNILKGLWQYFDKKDKQWYPCILKDIYETRVVVIRTNEMGYQDPESYKLVTITDPSETTLAKA